MIRRRRAVCDDMGSNHKDAFRGHLERLVAEVDPDLLRQSLFTKKIINERMMDLFKEGEYSRKERSRRLFKFLESRGVFSQLVDSLLETGYFDLAYLLNPDILNKTKNKNKIEKDGVGGEPNGEEIQPEPNRCHPNILPQAMLDEDPHLVERIHDAAVSYPRSLINIGEVPHTFTVKMATKRLDRGFCPDLQVYPMGSNPKGLLLLINNVRFENDLHQYRQGAEVDERNLTSVYEMLGYKVVKYSDLPLAQMKKKIVEFAEDRRLRSVCALAVAVMSHGKEIENKTMIIAQDGALLDIEWIVNQFNGTNCPSMVQRPKVFFFQTCRGEKKEKGVVAVYVANNRTQVDGSTDLKYMRASGDILIAHSTLPGYISNRDRHLGTWYIQAICEVFSEHACDTDLEDMLKMVDSRLSRLISEGGTMQASSYENRGFRKFFFVPGLYDEPARTSRPALVSRGTQSPCRQPGDTAQVETEISAVTTSITESVYHGSSTMLSQREISETITTSVSPLPMSQGSYVSESSQEMEFISLRSTGSDLSGKEPMSQESQPEILDRTSLTMNGTSLQNLSLSQDGEPMELELHIA